MWKFLSYVCVGQQEPVVQAGYYQMSRRFAFLTMPKVGHGLSEPLELSGADQPH